MPPNRALALPGVTEASGLDVSIQGLSLYVADAGQGTVDVLKLSGSRSRQGLTPAGQILKLTVGSLWSASTGNIQILETKLPVPKGRLGRGSGSRLGDLQPLLEQHQEAGSARDLSLRRLHQLAAAGSAEGGAAFL